MEFALCRAQLLQYLCEEKGNKVHGAMRDAQKTKTLLQ